MTDVRHMSIAELADAVRDRKLSAVEIAQDALARVARSQQSLNAFISVDEEGALAAARQVDGAIAAGRPVPPLAGVPVAHKDTYFRKGRRATCANLLRADFVPDHDATVAVRLDAAGAVELGSVNTSDSGCNALGLNILVGRARNPWNPRYTTGGSSSGSGAAVGARLVAGSFGSDSGGSARLPGAFCGAVALKPTDFRVSRYGIYPLSPSTDCASPIARTARDCARLLTVTAGRDENDPSTSPAPVDDYEAGIDKPLEGKRIGVPINYYWDGVEEEVGALVRASLDVFRADGADIVEMSVPDGAWMEAFLTTIVAAEGAATHAADMRVAADKYAPVTRRFLKLGLSIPATLYIDALRLRGGALRAYLDQVFSRVDMLFMPTVRGRVPEMEPANGSGSGDDESDWLLAINVLARNTRPFNYLGLPAVSVPCGFTSDRLPTAFQLAGPPFSEAAILNAAHRYQMATDFHLRPPPSSEEGVGIP
jgi:aspartyl-tRNA(Asn)/glutamyl-tRNA(Gln) amidotransferase subunit A